MKTNHHYEEYVYAGVLGKVIGVYLGRPFEGWSKEKIEERWGRIERYVHEDREVPLVVADDDISGTFTFVRALEDSGRYAETPTAFFGQTWLNYLIEGRTILWWGGVGHSTEHTAYLRLKQGIAAPESGSMRLNGKVVAEQIGAQIFIDAFGLVCPGKPALAATLARRAAAVSHDGEAVHAAAVVAAMIAAAYDVKEMDALLDIGVAQIPDDSLIAQVHRDVRAWRRLDDDWRATYDRIDEKYGYRRYGGNCHVIPNHAIMVMAWCYAPDNFHEAQAIINTAGWDTDCNAANVGALMGVKVGLDRIDESYDFRAPFADRIVLPTAEGTRSVSDCLLEAMHLARVGRRIMGWPAMPPPKGGAWHHFSLPGALHGYMSDEKSNLTRGAAELSNVARPDGTRALRLGFRAGPGRMARVATPLLAETLRGGYASVAVSRLVSGMTVRVAGAAGAIKGPATLRLFVRHADPQERTQRCTLYSAPLALLAGAPLALNFLLPDSGGMAFSEFGFEIAGATPASGEIFVSQVAFEGRPKIDFPGDLPRDATGAFTGWISDVDTVRGPFSDDAEPCWHIGKNERRGVLVAGTTDWRDYTFSCRLSVHMGEAGGMLVRYQGLERYLALVKTADQLRLVLRWYGDERVLGECDAIWQPDALHDLRLECRGQAITAWCDGSQIFCGTDDRLGCGGAGLLVDRGLIGWRDMRVY